MAQSWGGADKTEVLWTPGPYPLHPTPADCRCTPTPSPDLPHGTLDLAELERLVTRGLGSPYHPVCELICLENTHSSSGGRGPPHGIPTCRLSPSLCPHH